MPRKLITFECKYCDKTFDDYNKCHKRWHKEHCVEY